MLFSAIIIVSVTMSVSTNSITPSVVPRESKSVSIPGYCPLVYMYMYQFSMHVNNTEIDSMIHIRNTHYSMHYAICNISFYIPSFLSVLLLASFVDTNMCIPYIEIPCLVSFTHVT